MSPVLSHHTVDKIVFSLSKLVLSPHSAKEGPAQCPRPRSTWTRPLSRTESAGPRCVRSASLLPSYFSREYVFKSHNNKTRWCFFFFFHPCFWCAAEQKAWSNRNMSFYFWRAVIKWSVFSCSWTCCMRRLCTPWSTESECIRQNTWKVTKNCLRTCSR